MQVSHGNEGRRAMRAMMNIAPFGLPNFLRLDVPLGGGTCPIDVPMDVGHLFPTDKDAAEFWDECKAEWITHVQARRASLGE